MSKQIKLVHLTSSLKRGGAETILCDLVTHLPQEYFHHTVLYFHEGPNLERLKALNVNAVQIKGLFFQYDLIFFIRLYRMLTQLNPAGIHALLWAANISGRIMGRLLNIPCVSVYHNNVDQDGFFRNWLDRATVLLARRLVAVSPGIVQSIKDRDGVLPATRIDIIPNGVDHIAVQIKGRQYQKGRDEFGLTENHLVIGSVGRFQPVKRYDLLLESFAQINAMLPLTRLMLIGSGPQEQMLKKRAMALRIDHHVIFIIGQQAYGYYPLFDCFVQTSDKEGISMALLEAMSFGCACVVTSLYGEHPVIQSGINGLISEAGNAQALAKNIMTLLHDKRLRGQLAKTAQQTVENSFTLERMVTAYQTLFKELAVP